MFAALMYRVCGGIGRPHNGSETRFDKGLKNFDDYISWLVKVSKPAYHIRIIKIGMDVP